MNLVNQRLERLDFDSKHFDASIRRCFGSSVVKKAKLLQSSRTFQDKLTKYFYQSDSLADQLAYRMKADVGVRKDFDLALKEGLDAVKDPCVELKKFVESAENIPTFIDRNLVEKGGKVFRSKLDIPGLMLFGIPISTYIQGFIPSITLSVLFSMQPAGAPESVLHAVGRKPNKRRGAVRLLETFKWFGEVSADGAGQNHTHAYVESCRIRVVHAYIRSAIMHKKNDWNFSPRVSWDESKLGVPLSAADGSMVVTAVVAAIFSMRHHVKKNITQDEMEALNHWCNYTSYMQGVPEDLLSPNIEDTIAYFAAFMMSNNVDMYHHEVSSFLQGLQSSQMERALFRESKTLQNAVNGLTQATLNDLFSPDLRKHYNIKQCPWWATVLLKGTKFGISSINKVSRNSSLINEIIDKNSSYFWDYLIPESEKIISANFGSVSK